MSKSNKHLWISLIIVGMGLSLILVLLVWRKGEQERPLILQLKWLYNASFAGDLVAKEKGFWGMPVEVQAGAVGINPVRAVLSGQADIGVATGDQVLVAREEGAPLVAIALVYR